MLPSKCPYIVRGINIPNENERRGQRVMSERRTKDLPVKKNDDGTRIKGYSLRAGAFYSWLKRSGYTTGRIAKRLGMDEKEFVRKLENKEIFDRSQLRVIIGIMGAPAACFALYFPSFEQRRKVYRKVFGKELPLQENRQRRWKKN